MLKLENYSELVVLVHSDNSSSYHFTDLVDMPSFARMLESFFQATDIPNGVVDNNGKLLSMSSGEEVCLKTIRDIDIVGRIGGEEFAVLMPATGIEQSIQAVEFMRRAITAIRVVPGAVSGQE